MKKLLRGVAKRIGASTRDMQNHDEQTARATHGGTPCGSLTGRSRVTLVGTLRSVTIQPRGSSPALEAELSDGSGAVTIVWLGRRDIAGIQAGARLRVCGLVAKHDGKAMMYNPRYELLTAAVSS